MKIHSTRFGELDVDPANVITFPFGLPGFEQCRRFALIHDADQENPVLYRLQSLEDPDVTFTVTDPSRMGFDYDLELTDDEWAALELERPEDAAVLLMLSQAENEGGLNANVSGPLVLNTAKRRALQKVLGRLEYSITFKSPRV